MLSTYRKVAPYIFNSLVLLSFNGVTERHVQRSLNDNNMVSFEGQIIAK